MNSPPVVLVAAVARNGVIGREGALPWRLSTDLQRFKRLTMGKPVIMGRKTFESIGKALPGRLNIVITRSASFAPEGVRIAPNLDAALKLASVDANRTGASEIAVVGGGEIFSAAISKSDRLYITHVEARPSGDAHFPAIDPTVWRAASSERIAAGEKDTEATTFVVYERAGATRGGR